MRKTSLKDSIYWNHIRKTTNWSRTLLDGSKLPSNSRYRMKQRALAIIERGMRSWYENGLSMYDENYYFSD